MIKIAVLSLYIACACAAPQRGYYVAPPTTPVPSSEYKAPALVTDSTVVIPTEGTNTNTTESETPVDVITTTTLSETTDEEEIITTTSATTSDIITTVPSPLCAPGEVFTPYGCVKPELTRNLYVFREPETDPNSTDTPYIPPPKVRLNLLVIKTKDGISAEEQIVIPPPQEKTLVLVLSKKGDPKKRVVQVPAPQGQIPEVYFVDYSDGENPLLPGNIYLSEALRLADSQITEAPTGGPVTDEPEIITDETTPTGEESLVTTDKPLIPEETTVETEPTGETEPTEPTAPTGPVAPTAPTAPKRGGYL